ncbi:MAG: translation initiation factor IF-2, partial [Candidatus Omnitrophota bacterium]|nr:translation initiation factor IF-2 [Candidatus Omnitrophota bacterium]
KPSASAKPAAVKPSSLVSKAAAARAPVLAPGKRPAAAAHPVAPVQPSKPSMVQTLLPKPAVAAQVSAATMAPPKPQVAPVPAPRPTAPIAPAPPKHKPKPRAPEPAPEVAAAPVPAGPPKPLELKIPIMVKDLAAKMDVKASDLIKQLMQQGVFATIVQQLDEATATKAAKLFNFEVLPQPSLEDQYLKSVAPDPAKLVPRAPVVTLMGHVDHGKTSLLDAIRQSKVAEKEAGGITQHIGAYEVTLAKGRVTFLDTPGHEAFTALRARGANVTDVVVIVVAADDGVMPQTIEAINHAKAANVTIVVAMNKVDKPEANIQKVKQQLSEHGLIGEDWGGKTIMVPVSAKTRQGIDTLLEMLLLEAELLELKADPTTTAQGRVIEAKQTKDRGPVSTVLVQQGTLRVGETIVIGHLVGRVRAMTNDLGHRLKEAGPATPVEVLGLPEVPQAGDRFLVIHDDKVAKALAGARQEQRIQSAVVHPKRITLEELHSRITEGQLKELRFILKSDVQGSLEAIEQSLTKLDTEKEEVQFRILHKGVGDINESDVILAAASDAIIVGFHVGIEPKVQILAVAEGVDVHIYKIIYELVGAIKAAIEGLLEPTIEETFLGRAEVRKLFQVSKSGMVAGCMVTKGIIRRDATVRVIRGKDRVCEGKIANLKRVKDDAREVQEGVECGISVEGNSDFQVGDLIEAWELKKVARKLA